MKNKYWYFKKWGKHKICGITHGRLRPGKDKFGIPYVITLDCNHSFYTNALLEWSTTNETCPLCRIPFNFLLTIFKDYIIKK
jgi:hypothetical protein